MHCHVLGSASCRRSLGLWIADIRRRPGGPERSARVRAGLLAAILLGLSYFPLAVHELNADFSETRAAIGFIAGGGEPSSMALPVRILIVALRVLAWPLTGLVTEAPIAALLAASLVVAFAIWRAAAGDGHERTAARWFTATLAWTIVALDPRGERPRDRHSRAPERPLPRLRGSGRVRHHRTRGRRARSLAADRRPGASGPRGCCRARRRRSSSSTCPASRRPSRRRRLAGRPRGGGASDGRRRPTDRAHEPPRFQVRRCPPLPARRRRSRGIPRGERAR